ncbi:MAG: cysteine protease, partial [Smithellaceae bacterium]
MAETKFNRKLGWRPDYPDFRDNTTENDAVSLKMKALGQTDSIKTMFSKMGLSESSSKKLPLQKDLKEWCP